MSVQSTLDISSFRKDFPILDLKVNGRRLSYLDNGATSQKPLKVIETVDEFWRRQNANIHRGVHHLSQIATQKFEESRYAVQRLLNAASAHEVIFTKGCTESINLVASCLSSSAGQRSTVDSGKAWIREGDVILVSEMEHHSNIVPWQLAARSSGGKVIKIPVTDAGEIDLDAYGRLLTSHPVKVVAITHVSNAMGTINPIKQMVAAAHEVGALVLVDGAQAGPHLRIDVQKLDADFYTLSCHKIYAPTGIGVLYGKKSLLELMPAYQGGGDMIHTVDIENGTAYAALPAKFEAGTPNIAGAIGLGAAIEYLESIGKGEADPLAAAFERFAVHERALLEYAVAGLSEIEGLHIHGASKEKTGIVAFTLAAAHPHDVGTILDHHGVAARTGHHCCMPLMRRFGFSATTRASLAFYNDQEDVEELIKGVHAVREMFTN